MSAAMVVCGKRCYFDEEWDESFPLVTKKLRSGYSLVVDRLMEAFPYLDKQLLEKVLKENDNDVDSVTRSLNKLYLGHVDGNSGSGNAAGTSEEYAENSSAHGNIPVTKCSQQQIEALMQEKMALKEQNTIQNEALMRLKEQNTTQNEALMRLKEQVTILIRGVVSKHERQKDLMKEVSAYEERQKDYDNKTQELEHLKKKVSMLEMKIYALTMQQKQAQGVVDNSMPGRRHRDVF